MKNCEIFYPNYCRQFSERSSKITEFEERLRCRLCNKILIEPVQTECGCRFCTICITNYINDGKEKCLNCKEGELKRNKLIKDIAVEKEIMNLSVKCMNSECEMTLQFKDVTNHLSLCDYKKVQCIECKEWYQQSKEEEHIKEKCIYSLMKCDDCGLKMKRKDFYDTHRNYKDYEESICGMWLRDCPYNCNEEKLFNMKMHLKNCPNKPKECLFKEFGCTIKGSNEYIKSHMENDIVNHNMLLIFEMTKLKNDNNKTKILHQENQKRTEIEIKKSEVVMLETSNTIEKLLEKIVKIERNVKYTSTELIKYKMKPSNVDIDQCQATWTIKDIREKIMEAKSGGKNEIVSECFYIFRPGYNLSLKVYLNGEGCAVNKYLSVFFVINKGEYDSEISWPFISKVSISVLSNNVSKGDIVERMRPNNNEICYGKPSERCNLGAGQPTFLHLSEILNKDYYLHEKALKIRISILNT